jgi:D-glycero-alpha-D-manno-heptose 1-phosphate guanylyltransferase
MSVDALILAGGRGTRLASVAGDLAKCLVPIEGIPFLSYLLAFIGQSGAVNRIVLALGHGAEQVEQYLRQTSSTVPLATEVEPLAMGTGGAVLRVLDKITTESFLIINGDTLFDLSIANLLQHHGRGGHKVTVALVRVPDAERYGSVTLDGLQVAGFAEKRPGSGLVNAGIGVFDRKALLQFPILECSLEHDIMPTLVAAGEVGGFVSSGSFLDIGVPESYALASGFLSSLRSS